MITDQILQWTDETQEWEEVGRMKIARAFHGMTTIKSEGEVMDYCG